MLSAAPGPTYVLRRERIVLKIPGRSSVAFSTCVVFVLTLLLPPGYQWSMPKSRYGPATGSTLASQLRSGSATSPTPPGPTSTAPTLIVGSTAFMAAAKALKLLPYAVGDKAGLFPRPAPFGLGACRSYC